MPSPFPGMDPFLEAPTRWGGVHSRLINSISDDLAEAISPNFYVDIEERVYIITPDDPEGRPIVPDVFVVTGHDSMQTATTVAGVITTPTLMEPLYDVEIHDRYIEIRDTINREVITTIELLSPYNKSSGTPGREAFLRKRKKVMASKTHWIEIDLLRAGERPRELFNQSDYYVLLKRGGKPGPYEVWYFDVRDRMPTIAVPLRSPFEDVPLNLQAVFENTYARGHYAESTDYSDNPPLPRLRPADAAWVQERVREWLAARSIA
ncbi:MAG: hypothetical protein A2Z04_01650 [Chloroflexi bacterium RBG_16_57_9]|nr:MAG: hypothetical protein A2Z04_01650 [Chloroflexi bacterium RBG_16_57_9]